MGTNEESWKAITTTWVTRDALTSRTKRSSVIAFVQESFDNKDPATLNHVLNFLVENYERDVIPDSLRKWINTYTHFHTCRSTAMEDKRLAVDVRDISSCLDTLDNAVRCVVLLFTTGYTTDHVAYAHSTKGFITTDLFCQYLEHVFIPHVRFERHRVGYQGRAVHHHYCGCL